MPLFDPDTKWVPILKDADIQLAIFLSCGVLWIAGHFWGVVPVESWLLWVKVVFIVSGCFLLVSCIASLFSRRS
jgi:hypothetical protein